MSKEVDRLHNEWRRLQEETKLAHAAYSEALKAEQPFQLGDEVLAYKGYGNRRKLVKARIVHVNLKWGAVSYTVAWYKKNGEQGLVEHELWTSGSGPFPLDYVEPEPAKITPDML